MGHAEILAAFMEQYARFSKKELVEHEKAMEKLEAIQDYMEANGVTEIDTQYGTITQVSQNPRWAGTPDFDQLAVEFPNFDTFSRKSSTVTLRNGDEGQKIECPGNGRGASAAAQVAWDAIDELEYTTEEKARIRELMGLFQPDDKVVIREIRDPTNPPENWPYDDE